jgi:hypothetical protein
MGARELVESVRDDPEGRYQLRVEFYKNYGFAHDGGAGFGTSELDFLRWEINRGVLDPLNRPTGAGSPWWRDVNAEFIFCSELAAEINQGSTDTPSADLAIPVAFWLNYIRTPSRQAWYRAHNSTIVAAYLKHSAEAEAETSAERRFLNIVLYRLLYAQALVEGDAPGLMAWIVRTLTRHTRLLKDLESLAADPRGQAVDLIVHLPDFYPRHYPLSDEDVLHIFDKTHSIGQGTEQLLDHVFISPSLTRLYYMVGWWLGMPVLNTLVSKGKPCYPIAAAAPVIAPGSTTSPAAP